VPRLLFLVRAVTTADDLERHPRARVGEPEHAARDDELAAWQIHLDARAREEHPSHQEERGDEHAGEHLDARVHSVERANRRDRERDEDTGHGHQKERAEAADPRREPHRQPRDVGRHERGRRIEAADGQRESVVDGAERGPRSAAGAEDAPREKRGDDRRDRGDRPEIDRARHHRGGRQHREHAR